MANALATLVKQTVKAQANASKVVAAPAAKKAAPKSKQPKTAKPAAQVFKHRIVTGRPVAGAALYAFTAAWFEMCGLDKGKALSRKEAEAVAGHTAIAYHIREQRMVEKDGKVLITAGGKLHFKARADKIDSATKDAWKAILRTGKADGKLIKNQAMIGTI